MVILSSKISTTDDFVTFVQTAEAVSDILVHDGAVPLVLHPVGLPAFCAQSDALPDEISRLRSIAARDGVQVWNGGYTGASGIHLTTEEISWDLTWAHTNPWDSGFSRYVERSTTADFPVLLTATQAARLEEERSHPDDPLCVGYVGYTVEAPSSGVHQLWFLERGQWKWLSSRILNTSHNTEGVVPGTVDPVDCLHLIVPRSSAAEARENLVQIVTDVLERSMGSPPTGTPASTAGAPPAPRSAASAPRGTFFHSGIEYGRRWLNSSRAAAVAEIRRAQAVSRDRTAAILHAAAGRSAPEQLLASRRRSTATADSPDPFRNRELQGGVTGSLRLDTESVGAVFSAGRIAGLTTGEAALTPATRAQGFSQNSETTRYLETVSAAWFTGLRVRGVHEVANLPGTASVGITTFAMDQLPGLVMNITAQRSSSRGAEAIMRHALLEVPLYDIADTSRPRTGAILESSGDVREIAILPQLDDGLRDGADPVEWSIGAVGLRVDLAEASLWIIAAHPGAVLPICFSLGARAVSGGVRVSWYPMGFERHRTADPVCARWSVSYRIVATDQNSAALVSPRVEPDVAAEIDGFTCQRAVPGRNVPAT